MARASIKDLKEQINQLEQRILNLELIRLNQDHICPTWVYPYQQSPYWPGYLTWTTCGTSDKTTFTVPNSGQSDAI